MRTSAVRSVVWMCGALALAAGSAGAQGITPVSVSSTGTAGNGPSDEPSLSADGRFVAFSSAASNLVPGDTNEVTDVFVRDRVTAQTTRVSIGSTGAQANGESLWPSISADGRLVAFYSSASNLVPSDTNAAGDVFVHDRQSGQTMRVSVATGGVQTGGAARDFPSISGNGRYVGFWSRAADLVPGDTNATGDVFLHDRQTGVTTRVSATASGLQGDDNSFKVSLDHDGRSVAFLSFARNLAAGGDGGSTADLFVYSRDTGQHTRIGLPFDARLGGVTIDISATALSGDGRSVGFSSRFPEGQAATGPVALSVFVHDRATGQTSTVATRSLSAADASFGKVSLDDTGTLLTFGAGADPGCGSSTPGTATCPRQVFLHDRTTGATTRLDAPASGLTDEGDSSLSAVLSRNGEVAAFASDSRVLGGADTNQARDVFVRDTRIDSDSDGIPDVTELQFGLNPLVNDAAADADADGRTNLQEVQAGTHPRGFVTRYLAEGATSTFFDTRIALVNPSETTPASVLLRFLTTTGTTVSRVVSVPAAARRTIDVKSVPGLAAAEFSTVVESDTLVVVDRTMRWDATGYGSHAETAIASADTTWYFAEGATHSGFKLFYLLQNPGDADAQVEVTYLLPAPAAPLVKTYTVARQSRRNIWVNDEGLTDATLAALRSTDVSAVLRSTNGVPIIAERAMYLDRPQTFGAGHESAGVTAPAPRWFLAEGATGPYFDLFVLIANPGAIPADVRATYLLPTGVTLTKTYRIPARSRFNIWVDEERFPDASGDRRLANTAVSTTIESLDGVPIIVERAMWWPGPTATTWHEAHNSPGATGTGTRWVLAEGELGGPASVQTYILIANTSPTPGRARLTLLFEDGTRAVRTVDLPASSRFNVDVAAVFPDAVEKRFGAVVESIGAFPAQIVVERAMYSSTADVTWAAGTNALGSLVP